MTHYDEVFYNMQEELKKVSAPLSFISLMEYEQYLNSLDCDSLKAHNSDAARVPAENFEKKKIYSKVLKIKGCTSLADDKIAVHFAIGYITKIADELDRKGFIEIANILDNALHKFAEKIDCKDCK